jgi:hypothetical protein
MNYQIVRNSDIEKVVWDAYIKTCYNARIEAYSWYLDAVSPNWKACIIGDYEAVFPITIHKKWGLIPCWVNPPFCQQLGIFSKNKDVDAIAVLEKISKRFFKTHIHLNAGSKFSEGLKKRNNFILELNCGYEVLKANYNKDARKNLRKEVVFEIKEEAITQESIDETISIYLGQYGDKQAINAKLRGKLIALIQAANKHDAVTHYSIVNDRMELLFRGFVLKDDKRVYYLFASPTDAGRDLSITHYFIDFLISKYANSEMILDFEGSSIPSVAKFYAKWGSEVEEYAVFKRGV